MIVLTAFASTTTEVALSIASNWAAVAVVPVTFTVIASVDAVAKFVAKLAAEPSTVAVTFPNVWAARAFKPLAAFTSAAAIVPVNVKATVEERSTFVVFNVANSLLFQ